ncbi:MAG: acyl-CoA dehydrogenase family protein [Pseudomonadota bacterium]
MPDSITQNFVRHQAQHLHVSPLLAAISAQAVDADRTRNISPEVIHSIKQSNVMRLSAGREIGGLEASVVDIGRELEAVSAACTSTAWCLWNHICVFHFYCGLLGPERRTLLQNIVEDHHWVSLPAGAGTSIQGHIKGDQLILNGEAAFGSGARYGEWAGVTFRLKNDDDTSADVKFVIIRTDAPGVRIEPTWNGMSVRASATDHIFYEDAAVPLDRMVDFSLKYRTKFRQTDYPMLNHRYREDWVAFSDMWLGAMAVGLAQAALDETCAGIQERIAIMGVKMVQRPTIHVNLGQAGAMISTARAAVYDVCAETDRRIEAGEIPTEADYLRQLAGSMMAIKCCDDAMRLILRVLGGNGLRESAAFERRYRDFQAMPLHINVHQDRVSEQVGRHLLGLDTENPF